MCAYVCFPEIARAGRGTAARGAKKTAPWWQIKWRQKKRRRGITCSVIMIMGRKTLRVSSVKAFVQRNVSIKDVWILQTKTSPEPLGEQRQPAPSSDVPSWVASPASCGTQCCGTCGEAKGALGTQAGTWAPCEVGWKLRVGTPGGDSRSLRGLVGKALESPAHLTSHAGHTGGCFLPSLTLLPTQPRVSFTMPYWPFQAAFLTVKKHCVGENVSISCPLYIAMGATSSEASGLQHGHCGLSAPQDVFGAASPRPWFWAPPQQPFPGGVCDAAKGCCCCWTAADCLQMSLSGRKGLFGFLGSLIWLA